MTGTIAPLLPVTPEDRMAAWPFVPSNSIAGTNREGFFAGGYDSAAIVQAFARHRISHSLPGDVESVASMLANIRQGRSDTPRCEPLGQYAIDRAKADVKDVFKAIAALTPSALSGDAGGKDG